MSHPAGGGPTLILNQSISPDMTTLRPLVPSRAGLVYPRASRHSIFQGNLYHGVRADLSPADPSPDQTTYPRVTLLLNWWARPLHAQSTRVHTWSRAYQLSSRPKTTRPSVRFWFCRKPTWRKCKEKKVFSGPSSTTWKNRRRPSQEKSSVLHGLFTSSMEFCIVGQKA